MTAPFVQPLFSARETVVLQPEFAGRGPAVSDKHKPKRTQLTEKAWLKAVSANLNGSREVRTLLKYANDAFDGSEQSI